MNMDLTILVLYVMLVLSAGYGFGLFGWWWWKQKWAGPVYLYVMLLMFGIGYSQIMCIWARIDKALYSPDVWHAFIESWAFSTRGIFTLIAILLIDIHMTYRAFWGSKNLIGEHKSVKIKGGKIEYAHIKDAEPVELRIAGKKVEVAILRKAANEVVIILDADIAEVKDR